MLKKSVAFITILYLSACNLATYQPLQTIEQLNPQSGYRMKEVIKQQDSNLILLMFSGGGSRAAALGYGVLEQFKHTPVKSGRQAGNLLENIDLVYGVSGGSLLAAYFALQGADVIPKFENDFLKKNFQSEVINQILSFSNLPRLTSPQFGRGDLLQEQLNLALYRNATFADLAHKRKGPFAVISATDMNIGQKITFTQEFFDGLCLNLNDLEIARAVAASSSVPLIFSPLTLNNNGGNCNYTIPELAILEASESDGGLKSKNIEEVKNILSLYQNSKERPFIHLVDGGLTDNLGLSSLTDIYDVMGQEKIYRKALESGLKRIVVINVNAQNEVTSEIDQSADVPGVTDVVNTIINVPIDRNTQITLRRFREFAEQWNKNMRKIPAPDRVELHFVSLSLKDLPESPLRKEVLNISTSFYLPASDINKLKRAAQILLENSTEYRTMLKALQQSGK